MNKDCRTTLRKFGSYESGLYNIDGQIYFGELTFFDQGGFDTDITFETDLKWGELMDLEKIK